MPRLYQSNKPDYTALAYGADFARWMCSKDLHIPFSFRLLFFMIIFNIAVASKKHLFSPVYEKTQVFILENKVHSIQISKFPDLVSWECN